MSLPKILISNSLSGKKEELVPHTPGKVTIYGCGPTVYGKIHVGNAMAALTADLVVRVLKLAGYTVENSSNITDVDDKIIKAANDAGVSAETIAKKFADIYLNEMKVLDVAAPSHRPHATQCIPDMIAMIAELIKKDFAYAADTPFGKDVYFRVRKFDGYGKLSRKNLDDLLTGARVEPGEAKQDPLDFAMWKAAKPGEPLWPSPWGNGRPGWHIECSAMIHKHFPDGIDIHMGGLDLLFPHHENEIAQSEACFNKPLARYWVHNNLLTLEKEKMSKSLGNIFTLEDFLTNYGPEVLRLFLFQHHYRSPVDFSDESITRAEALLNRLYLAKKHVLAHKIVAAKCASMADVEAALWDDFNTAKAMGFMMKRLREAFKTNSKEAWAEWACTLCYFEKVYGILGNDPDAAMKEICDRKFKRLGITETRAQEIENKLAERTRLRAEKKFEDSDKLRAELEASGVIVMDSTDASTWSIRS